MASSLVAQQRDGAWALSTVIRDSDKSQWTRCRRVGYHGGASADGRFEPRCRGAGSELTSSIWRVAKCLGCEQSRKRIGQDILVQQTVHSDRGRLSATEQRLPEQRRSQIVKEQQQLGSKTEAMTALAVEWHNHFAGWLPDVLHI